MMLFRLWFGRCFEPELFVPNTTARVGDVTANTEICRREARARLRELPWFSTRAQ
jgi:hypothetical protein